MQGRGIRYGRLFGPENRAVVVACDHGLFAGPHAGMEDIPAMLDRLGDAPDGILLAPGMLGHARAYFGRPKAPVALTRLNFNSVFCKWNYQDAVISNLYEPGEALANGADWVLACLTLRTGSEARDAANAENVARLTVQAHGLGIPVLGEYFPIGHLSKKPDEFHEEVLVGCRMLAEIGVDAIKTFHTSRFRELTGTCPVPILGLGAEKTPTDLAALQLAEREVAEGARGVVFGRNAVQSSNPPAFVAALQDIVRKGMKAKEAAAAHGLGG